MAEHPCAEGLTPECFRLYPEWAKKVAAYRFLLVAVSEDLLSKVAPWLVDIGTRPPPGWPEGEPPPEFLSRRVKVPEAVRSYGLMASHFIAPFSAGPVHAPAAAPGLKTYTAEITATEMELLYRYGYDWSEVRNGTNSIGVTLSDGIWMRLEIEFSESRYSIQRTGLKFNLTGIPPEANMISGYVKLSRNSGDLDLWACVQRGPTALWNNIADYSSMAGSAEGPHALTGVPQIFELGAVSLAYCKAQAGALAYFIVREYDHDYGDVAPIQEGLKYVWFYDEGNLDPALRPKLVLVYQA